ncbi:glycoside hydrolase family 2 TIM barrel-domain containing protein [Tenacibaculum xiamenense]|uniref:glycoside hydrolase family 2 TIM barrel-domain containing protein n=1 Tax=Tenacibaculum xiamenense TaxID=1261553 RepID=UPI0038948E06
MKIYSKILLLFVLPCFTCTSYEQDVVKVLGRKLLVNDQQFLIKGVCYHPVPRGSNNVRNFDKLDEDIALMKELGVNTIRVYEPIKEITVLNKLARNNIKVIMGFGYSQEGNYDLRSGKYLDYVKKYKNHKAILMWELGNEYNYHSEWFERDDILWYRVLNQSAKAIHDIDKNHPVSTAHGDLPDELAILYCPEIDVWGMNVLRWDDPSTVFYEWEKISGKPMYLSEAGSDSYMTISSSNYKQGENQRAQADANEKILNEIFKEVNICSGVTLFSFVDEWWKEGNCDVQDIGEGTKDVIGVPYDGYPNEEYWGIVDMDRNKKETFNVVKRKYNQVYIGKASKEITAQPN